MTALQPSLMPSAPGASQPLESLTGGGTMINWITVADADLPLFEDWYNFQHLVERVSTPGFRRARRFVAAQRRTLDTTDFLTVYETDDVQVLSSPEYLRRLDSPTELTRRVVPLFVEFRRAACTVTAVAGLGSSARVLAVEIPPGTDLAEVRRRLTTDHLPRLIAGHLLHVGSLHEPDAGVTAAKASTAEGRSSVTQQPAESALLLLEPQTGVDADTVTAELVDLLPGITGREFTLLFEMRSAPAPVAAQEGPA
ncbi:hypothetical protein JL107_06345 [Nakamurella flavida]|uniref:Uncharacterized protein n=1 Tax=Nakamurella flavida TaxID=363630 RepID=A0A938YJW9_9ACTN|nr:hypothetical protein [Nakamurella flavida]MBM9476058.1 hypothetical protein [Nakamurella flavida]MDP9777199.1 hypothetical protein [Nakamurella flavida]